MKNLERLGNLIFDIAEGWKKQQMYAFDRSEMMYDCSLYDCQNAETAFEPKFKNGRAFWDCDVTTNCGNTWYSAELSIPKWLYDYYMKGKADFISWRKVESDVNYENVTRGQEELA